MKITIQSCYELETVIEVPDGMSKDEIAKLADTVSEPLRDAIKDDFTNNNPYKGQSIEWAGTVVLGENDEEIASW